MGNASMTRIKKASGVKISNGMVWIPPDVKLSEESRCGIRISITGQARLKKANFDISII
jgi:hypothetical protein